MLLAMAARHTTEADDLFKELGRFVYVFSQMLEHMRVGAGALMMSPDPTTNRAWTAALGQLDAAGLTKVFFEICTLKGDLDTSENAIRKALKTQVMRVVERRNELMHHTWWHAVTGPAGPGGSAPIQFSTTDPRPGSKSKSSGDITDEQLRAFADNAEAVLVLVWAFVSGCNRSAEEWPRVRDRLEIRGDAIVHKDLAGFRPATGRS
jgi:hypothetical protein